MPGHVAAQGKSPDPHAGRARYQDLDQCMTITVKLHKGGTVRATVGRLDLASRRMVFAGLAEREWAGDPMHAAVQALWEAATELSMAQGEQLRLF